VVDTPAIGARERKVMLHLERHAASRNSLVAPHWVTQAGISESTALSQSNVSSVMRALASAGFATSRVGLVEGERRARSVYFLTDEGLRVAARLGADASALVCRPASLPESRPVFGRARELRLLTDWLRSARPRLAYVQGMAGIGKTTLLLAFLAQARSSISVLHFRFHPWTTPAQMLAEVGEFLAALGRPALRALVEGGLRQGTPPDPGLAAFRLKEDLRGLRVLIAVEDYHDAAADVRDLVSALAHAVGEGGVLMIADGREAAAPFDARAVSSGSVLSIKLGGLDPDAVGEMLAHRAEEGKARPADASKVLRITGGNPLFVQLLPSDADLSRPSELRDFLAKEVESRLRPEEAGLLRALCVHRGPVPLSAFAAPGLVDVVGALGARSLIESRDGGASFEMHAMLREFFYNSLTKAERAELHAAAARHYASLPGPEAAFERLWHFNEGGDRAEVEAALLDQGEALLRAGLGSSLLAIARATSRGVKGAGLTLLQARCEVAVGDLEAAAVSFASAFGSSREPTLSARACEGAAYCATMAGDAAGSKKWCGLGLRAAAGIRDRRTRTAARTGLLKELGSARIVAGEDLAAIRALGPALRAARSLGDDRLLAGCLNSLGMAYRGLGKFAEARPHFERSRALVLKLGDQRLDALSLNNLGVAQWAEGDYAGATESLVHALRAAERIGEWRAAMYSRLNLGIIAANQGRREEAIAYVERAIASAEQAGSPSQVAVARADLADVLLQCGDAAGALRELERAERDPSSGKDPHQKVQWSLVGMRACIALGRTQEAESRLREAREAARGTRSAVLRAAVLAGGAELALRAGRLKDAARLAPAASRFFLKGLGDFREGAKAIATLGETLLARGKPREGARHLEMAASRFDRLGAAAEAARCRALKERK
jgi:tetratricopeptide (TPR) repeat protein/DNA-binding MarR family transcriptional regulator